jgi:hypothetical protein
MNIAPAISDSHRSTTCSLQRYCVGFRAYRLQLMTLTAAAPVAAAVT